MTSPSIKLTHSPAVPAPVELDPQQAKAVSHRGTPLFIAGGPGTGKTSVLIEAAVSRINSGQDPDSILMLTYGRQRASEMRDAIAPPGAEIHDPPGCDPRRRHDPRLSLAIIAQPRGFQDRRRPDLGNRRLQIGQRIHRPIGRAGQAKAGQEILLKDTVLRHRQGAAVRPDRANGVEGVQRLGRDVLEFIGHDIYRSGKGAQGGQIVIGGGRHPVGHMSRRRVGAGLIDMRPKPKA